MYPSPEEIKDQEIESNKCNYPKSLILFCEFCCSLFETQFFYTNNGLAPCTSYNKAFEFNTSGKRRDGSSE